MRERINLGTTHQFCRELKKFYELLYKILLGRMLDYAASCSDRIDHDIEAGYIRRDVLHSTVCIAIAGYLTLFADIDAEYTSIHKFLAPVAIVVFVRGLSTIKRRAYIDQQLKQITQ